MSAVADRSEFLRVIELSKLIDPEVYTALAQTGDLPDAPGELAERLVQQGILTRFQAKQLLAGRHRGFILGPYRLLDQIGQGGMGMVYLAEHAALKRKVAIKVLSREQAENPAAIDRFQREARAASALCHPNIMRVHHVGQAGGAHYLVMEYIDGATLEDLIDRKGPLGIDEAVKVAAQAAAGLQHAHEKGFVHRDIKPENLMFTQGGVLKILDMGLTKSVSCPQDNLTGLMNTDVILGTIDYLSPEQAMQSGADARADLYSLGATLFTLLTGVAPYEGVPAKQKLMQHQCGAVPDVRTFCPEVPAELAAVVAKMMAKKPEDRYQTALEVIDALTPWLGKDGVADLALTMPSGVMKMPIREQSKTPTGSDSGDRTSPDFNLPPVRPRDGSITRADLRPDPKPLWARPWVWAIAGVVLGGAAVAVLFLV